MKASSGSGPQDFPLVTLLRRMISLYSEPLQVTTASANQVCTFTTLWLPGLKVLGQSKVAVMNKQKGRAHKEIPAWFQRNNMPHYRLDQNLKNTQPLPTCRERLPRTFRRIYSFHASLPHVKSYSGKLPNPCVLLPYNRYT